MPRRKKLPALPDYKGAGRNPDNLLVQKSNPLLTLSETNMTLAELKILDAYLSRIDSHDPEKRFIRLEKGQIEDILGVTHQNNFEIIPYIESEKIYGNICLLFFYILYRKKICNSFFLMI